MFRFLSVLSRRSPYCYGICSSLVGNICWIVGCRSFTAVLSGSVVFFAWIIWYSASEPIPHIKSFFLSFFVGPTGLCHFGPMYQLYDILFVFLFYILPKFFYPLSLSESSIPVCSDDLEVQYFNLFCVYFVSSNLVVNKRLRLLTAPRFLYVFRRDKQYSLLLVLFKFSAVQTIDRFRKFARIELINFFMT